MGYSIYSCFTSLTVQESWKTSKEGWCLERSYYRFPCCFKFLVIAWAGVIWQLQNSTTQWHKIATDMRLPVCVKMLDSPKPKQLSIQFRLGPEAICVLLLKASWCAREAGRGSGSGPCKVWPYGQSSTCTPFTLH